MASIVHDAPPPAPAPLGGPRIVETDNIYVGLSDEPLNILTTIARVKSPKAGAVVMFAGTASPFLFTKSLQPWLIPIVSRNYS